MDREGKKRLLKLADVLHENSNGRVMKIVGDGHAHFNLETWGQPGGCGTSACACGYATTHPWFQKQGLGRGQRDFVPRFQDKESWDAVQAFFAIDFRGARHLFEDSQYREHGYNPTPKQVAKRIRAFVASQEG